jgi:hypothetical protein
VEKTCKTVSCKLSLVKTSTHRQKLSGKNSLKNVPYRVKANKAKQPVPEIEVEDDLVIDDDDDLDLIDRGDR